MPAGYPYMNPPHPPGEILYCTSGYARCESFFHSLMMTNVPSGTAIQKNMGTGIAAMMNQLIQGLLPQTRWVWILGDDHEFSPTLLQSLISRAEMYQCDMLVPLVCLKVPPFSSVLYGKNGRMDFHDLPLTGDKPVPVRYAGTAGMLVQRYVLDKIGFPWFKQGWQQADSSDEDIWLCKRAEEEGFKCWVDPTLSMSHIPAEIMVEPVRTPSGWFVKFKWPDGRNFMIPMQRPIT